MALQALPNFQIGATPPDVFAKDADLNAASGVLLKGAELQQMARMQAMRNAYMMSRANTYAMNNQLREEALLGKPGFKRDEDTGRVTFDPDLFNIQKEQEGERKVDLAGKIATAQEGPAVDKAKQIADYNFSLKNSVPKTSDFTLGNKRYRTTTFNPTDPNSPNMQMSKTTVLQEGEPKPVSPVDQARIDQINQNIALTQKKIDAMGNTGDAQAFRAKLEKAKMYSGLAAKTYDPEEKQKHLKAAETIFDQLSGPKAKAGAAAGPAGAPPSVNWATVPSYDSQEEAQSAADAGDLDDGDPVVIGGEKFRWVEGGP